MDKFSFLAEESAILIYAGALGLEMGLFYDSLRIIRRIWKCNIVVIVFMDLLFWGFSASRTFYIMHTYSNGTLRWFAILGVLAILFIYMKWFSGYIVRASMCLLLPIKSVMGRIKKILTKNIKLSIMKLGKYFRKGKVYGKKSSVSDEIP
jgi:hypothetical protein